jgi:hypothetical protein
MGRDWTRTHYGLLLRLPIVEPELLDHVLNLPGQLGEPCERLHGLLGYLHILR